MGIKGTYIQDNNLKDDTQNIFNRNDEAYYIIDNIKLETIYEDNNTKTLKSDEHNNLLISVSIYKNYNARINRFQKNNELEVINFNTTIQKNIIVNKIWKYCYNIAKIHLQELIENRLKNNNNIFQDIYKNSIILDDV